MEIILNITILITSIVNLSILFLLYKSLSKNKTLLDNKFLSEPIVKSFQNILDKKIIEELKTENKSSASVPYRTNRQAREAREEDRQPDINDLL